MKKLFLAMAVTAAMAIGAGQAYAQCCDGHDFFPEDPNSVPADCGPIDPTASQTSGCEDLGGGNCIGGSLVTGSPAPADGCLCVGGNCEAGSQSFGDDAAACAESAARACCLDGSNFSGDCP